MQVDVVDTYVDFKQLESDWNDVYAADSDAQFFLSWQWLSQVFIERKGGWCILCVKSETTANYVAFFPLRIFPRMSREDRVFHNEIRMAGTFSWADYTGFLCDPACEREAIPSLSASLKQLRWSQLHLRHLLISDGRLEQFISAFPETEFVINVENRVAESGTINNEVCPYVDLPADFETYLTEKVSSNSRQKMRRFLREVDDSTELRITLAVAETQDRDLDILLGFWKQRWAKRKGERVDYLAGRYREILQAGFDCQSMFLPVLWRGDVPLGAIASFMDQEKKVLLHFVAGRDDSSPSPPAGFLLHAYSIRWAIENKFECYDFLRGDEAYKYSFGASERRIRNIKVRAKSNLSQLDHLDPRCIDEALTKLVEYEEAGRLRDAERGYRQVLVVEPDHPTALRRYGGLLYQAEKFVDSEAICKRLVDQQPENGSAWRQLGKSRLALNDYDDAAIALRTANDLEPTVSGHYYLARALRGLSHDAEAAEELAKTLKLKPRGVRETKQQRRREELN